MGSRARHRFLAGLLAVCVAAALSACASPDDGGVGAGRELTIGSQGDLENEIIARLYGEVLAENGYVVDYNTGVGPRSSYLTALQDGVIDIIPETSGSLLYETDSAAFAQSTDDVVEALPDALAELKLHVLRASPAENADAFVVTTEFSRTKQVTSIGDLAYLNGSITIGSAADFESRRYGRAGLLAAYEVSGFAFKTIDDDGGIATVGELLTGAVQVAVIPSTTPSITRNHLVTLTDPKSLITAQNIIPLVNENGYTNDVSGVLDPLSKALTTADLRELNDAVSASGGPTPERVAHAWLVKHGIVR